MTNELEPQRTSLDPVTIHADLSEWIIKVTGETNAIISKFAEEPEFTITPYFFPKTIYDFGFPYGNSRFQRTAPI